MKYSTIPRVSASAKACSCGQPKKPMSRYCWSCYLKSRPVRACKVDGCERTYLASGYCQLHYTAWRAHGDPLVNLRPNYVSGSPEKRFWAKVDKSGPLYIETCCWQWTGAKGDHGYGVFNEGSTLVGAHRFSYDLAFGEISDGLSVYQICRNRSCVRPEHLEAIDSEEVGRRNIKETCRRGHDMSDAYVRREGARMCRTCIRIRARRRASTRPHIPKSIRRRVLEGQACAYCGCADPRTIDHILPNADRQRFGIDFLDERFMVASCLSDNVNRGTRRLLPQSWAHRVEEMNARFPGTPWRIWDGDVNNPAYREVHR